jgi:Domain of unknown function (DUF1851)
VRHERQSQSQANAGLGLYGRAVRITLSDLTVNIDDLDSERLLDDWRWLIGPSKRLVLVSAIGDAFLQDDGDGSIHLLDTAAGSCSLVAQDAGEFRSLLADSAWVTDNLAALVIADFLGNDLRLERGEIYSWKRPPVLGGEYELANAETSDIAVHFSITGQIHQQVRDLPAGTPITELRIGPEQD